MSAWLRGQQQPSRSNYKPNKSAVYNQFFAIQGGCQEQIQSLFEVLALDEQQAAMQGFTKDMMVQRMTQRKNECFARSLCPTQVGRAYECILSPTRVAQGECDALLEDASQCTNSFWENALNAQVEQGMRKYATCADGCSESMAAQMACVQREGQQAPQKCRSERRTLEVCLGSCLEPALGDQYRAQCSEDASSPACTQLQQQLSEARERSGRNTLLAMGFANSDFSAQEPPDTLMDVVGMIVFTSALGTENEGQ